MRGGTPAVDLTNPGPRVAGQGRHAIASGGQRCRDGHPRRMRVARQGPLHPANAELPVRRPEAHGETPRDEGGDVAPGEHFASPAIGMVAVTLNGAGNGRRHHRTLLIRPLEPAAGVRRRWQQRAAFTPWPCSSRNISPSLPSAESIPGGTASERRPKACSPAGSLAGLPRDPR